MRGHVADQTFTSRAWKAAPHAVLVACAVMAYGSTEVCTWRYGGAIWGYWRAGWHAEEAAGEQPGGNAGRPPCQPPSNAGVTFTRGVFFLDALAGAVGQ